MFHSSLYISLSLGFLRLDNKQQRDVANITWHATHDVKKKDGLLKKRSAVEIKPRRDSICLFLRLNRSFRFRMTPTKRTSQALRVANFFSRREAVDGRDLQLLFVRLHRACLNFYPFFFRHTVALNFLKRPLRL